MRNAQTIDLVEKYSNAENSAFKTKRGRTDGGTWAIEEMVYAYASWLSAEFHKAVLDAFTAAVHGDMVKVKEIVRTAVRQEGVSNPTVSLQALDNNEKQMMTKFNLGIKDTSGNQNILVVSEGGMYTLALRCRQASLATIVASCSSIRFRK
ncbi:KilA-N domain-containing protein [Salmonella enterica]